MAKVVLKNLKKSFQNQNILHNINLEIIDAVGREVYASKHIVGSFVLPIDFTHLSKGVYLAKFINLNGEMITQKITIN